MLDGAIIGGVHRLTLRVYYEDTDFSGHVYHANYLKFCERARSDFLRVHGVDQNAMIGADGGLMFVVRRMACEFLKPARFDDVLLVETRRGETAGARFELDQRVLRGEEVVFSAAVTAALIDGRGKPRRLPPELFTKLAKVPS